MPFKPYLKQFLYVDIVQTERSFICADTGALVQGSAKRFQPYMTYACYATFLSYSFLCFSFS